MKTDVKWPNLTSARCVSVVHLLPDASLRVCVAHIDTPGTLLFRGIIDAKNPRKRYARIIRPSEFRTSVVGASWQGPELLPDAFF